MSRSNPTSNNPHPCTRWFEFGGGDGTISYYSKELKQKVDVPIPFSFIWLDETATVRGWHDSSQSGIMSNEVRDTRSDVMVVRAFKGGELCHGLYAQIRDRVGNLGGHYSANMYLGYREGASGPLKLGCLQLKGAALNAWVDFKKINLAAISTGGITLKATKDGKKGSVSYKTPVFEPIKIKPETNEEAIAVDKLLQDYLRGYFARTKAEQPPPPVPAPTTAETASDEPPILSDDEIPPDDKLNSDEPY